MRALGRLGVTNVLGIPLATPADAWNWWYQGAFSQNAKDLPSILAEYADAMWQASGPDADPAAVRAAIAQGQAQIAHVYNQVQAGVVIPWDDPASNPANASLMLWLLLGAAGLAVGVGVAIVK